MSNPNELPQKDSTKDAEKSVHDKTVEIYEKGLDDLVNVNSMFTTAVFIGLAFTPTTSQRSLETMESCHTDVTQLAKRLVVSEVISFSSFFLSSLLAKTMKFHVKLLKRKDLKDKMMKTAVESQKEMTTAVDSPKEMNTAIDLPKDMNNTDVDSTKKKPAIEKVSDFLLNMREVVFMLSGMGSIVGCFFLLLSMVDVIQIRLGMWFCGSTHALIAVTMLIVIVSPALAFYIPSVVLALYLSWKESDIL